jgi:hypothetical protein
LTGFNYFWIINKVVQQAQKNEGNRGETTVRMRPNACVFKICSGLNVGGMVVQQQKGVYLIYLSRGQRLDYWHTTHIYLVTGQYAVNYPAHFSSCLLLIPGLWRQ